MEERSSQKLLRFLRSLASRERPATHLFLVGDIFDLWVGDHDFYEKRFAPIVAALADCRRAGIGIRYFEGNHDVHVKRYWEKRDVPCSVDEVYEKLGPYLARVEHGDLINLDDTTYLRYRRFIRTGFMRGVAQWIPAPVFQKIGDFASRQSRKRSSVKRRDSEKELRQMIRDHAVRAFDEAPFDLIVTGHMHIRDDWEFERAGRKARSVNLGSWFDEARVFHLTGTGGSWVTLEDE